MDKPKSPPPHATTSAAGASSRSMENIKSLLLKCAVASTPAKKSLTPHQKAFIEERIGQIFPNIHTPDHPPYAWMIENAIRQLNEDCGSSEESISKFIVEEHKDLPFAHASLLRHHLKKLSESGDLNPSRNGCYSISKSRNLHNPTSKPCPKLTNTTSLIPVFSSCPSPSSSSSYGCESSTTYSSSELDVPITKGKRKTRRKKIKRKMSQNARGIKIRTKHDSGRGRGRGRCRGRGRRLGSNENTVMEVHVDHQYITIDDDVACDNIQGNQNQDSVDVESRVDKERIEPMWQEKLVGGVDNGSTPGMSCRKKMNISGQGSKNVGPRQRSVRSIHTPQRGKKRGRPSLRDMQMEEYGNNMEMERDNVDDMLDELIEEVYMELKGETERERLEIRDDRAEVMRCELNPQCTDDEIHETFGLEPLEREPRVNGNLEEDLGSGTHAVNENQFQLHPGQTELALVLDESQRRESNGIEHQVQRKGAAMEIIEQIDTREGEKNRIENPLEVVEKQIEHIEISDGLNCVLVDREITAEEEFGHYDELKKVDNVNKNSEEQYNCEKSRVDDHPHEPQVEDRDQQSEELAMVLPEQAVDNVADHDLPKDETNEIIDVAPLEQDHHKSTDDDPNELQLQECTSATPNEPEEVVIIKQKLVEDELEDEAASDGQLQLNWRETEMIEEQNEHIGQPEPILEQNQPEKCCKEQRKLQIENGEDQNQQNGKEKLKKEVNPMAEPQRRQLRPRPLKFQQEQTQQQFGLFTPEKSAETNSCRKLRPRLSKNESNEAANRSARLK